MLATSSIRQIPTDSNRLYAFRITGKVSAEDMEAMAEHMNAAFDAHSEKIDMLMIFDSYGGAETGAGWSWENIKSRFRALSNVDRYLVVGAPEAADRMIEAMDKVIPVRAEAFDSEAAAWRALGARELTA